jgi:hypothetical protein
LSNLCGWVPTDPLLEVTTEYVAGVMTEFLLVLPTTGSLLLGAAMVLGGA